MRRRLIREFEATWRLTAPRVRSYILCACGDLVDADDLVQECYLRALKSWHQFDAKASREAWLFGIARRTCVDWFRKKRRNVATVSLEDIQVSTDVVTKERLTNDLEAVWDAIKSLKEEQVEVIHLRFAAGLSYSEISETLEIPIGTVRSRLHRGLKAVREQIEETKNGT